MEIVTLMAFAGNMPLHLLKTYKVSTFDNTRIGLLKKVNVSKVCFYLAESLALIKKKTPLRLYK